MWRVALATIFIVAALAASLARPADAQTTTLKFAAQLPTFSTVAKDVLIPWMQAIEADSGGTVKFQQFWSGQLIQNPKTEWQSFQNGVVDVDVMVPAFFEQVLPDSAIFALPDVVHSAVEAAYGGWKMNEAGLLRGMDKLYVAATFSNDPGGIHLAKVVTSLGDLKGLKICVSGPAEAQIVQALGAAPVGMNITDTAESLSRGLYEGSLNGWTANRLYRISPVLKSHVDISLGVRQFVLGINKDVFNGLAPQAKEAIAKNSGLALSLRAGAAMEQDGQQDRAEAQAKGTIVKLSPEDQQRLAGIYQPLLDKWVADTPDGAKKLAFLRQALADYRKDH